MHRTPDNRRRPSVAVAVVARARVELLESRQLLASVEATPYEQFALELINRARANPAAEAARLKISLNEGLPAGKISDAAKQPLAMNGNLTDAARDHLVWLRQNAKFQHEGAGGSSPQQRMASAGYAFSGSYGSAENLALSLATTLGDVGKHVETLYQNLFLDKDVAGRGHRINLMNGSMREVGSGATTGDYVYNGNTWKAVLIGQNLAYSSGNAFLTGVAYDDKLKLDKFYSPGEGVAGITVTATSTSGKAFSTTTNNVGGYELRLAPGTYTITGTRVGMARPVTYNNVTIGSQNVKRDFVGSQFTAPASTFASLSSRGGLSVTGTGDNDIITITRDGTDYVVKLNGDSARFAVSATKSINVDARGGNDVVSLGDSVIAATIRGGAGNDTLAGGQYADRIYGDDGRDRLSGNSGDDTMSGGAGDDNLNGNGGKNTLNGEDGKDRLNGSGGPDKLYGGGGDDRLYGNGAADLLDGGGNNDRLYGGDGNDTLRGSGGRDRLYGHAGDDDLNGGRDADLIDGGPGKDRVRDRTSIDTVLAI